jgi:hypothetical protein
MNTINNIIVFIIICIFASCTSNPFSKDEKVKNNTQIISGQIKLSDQILPDSIYVWLEEFDIGVFTNTNGEFRLSLPPAQEQPGGGVTGVFNLYFYVVNYELNFIEVTVNDGLFLYDYGEIDKYGSLKDVIILQKLLNVKTEVNPQHIPADFRGYIYVSLTMNSIDNPTKISAIMDDNNIISGIFIRNLSKKDEFVKQYFMTSSHITIAYVPTVPSSSTSYYRYIPCEFPKGEYEIIPFIWVEQNNIPAQLMDDFTPNPGSMSLDYLKLPFKRTNAIVKIEYCDHTIGDDP